MAIQPSQPQSIGGVLDTMFRLYKACVLQVVPLSGAAALVGLPASIYQMRWTGRLDTGDQAAVAVVGMMFSDPVYWGLMLATLLLQLWLFTAMTFRINAIGSDRPMPTKEAMLRAVRPVASLLVMYLVYFLTVVLTSIVLIGVFLMVSWILGYLVVLFESKGPMAALRGSHRLVWGNWWRTTAILTVGGIILFVIYMALALVFGGLIAVIGVAELRVFETLASTAIAFVVTLFITPLYPAMFLSIYWDLRLRKHGADLEARVGALSASA